MQTIKIFRQLNRKKIIKNTDRFLIELLDKGMKKVNKLEILIRTARKTYSNYELM
jgi:hypothetical protein